MLEDNKQANYGRLKDTEGVALALSPSVCLSRSASIQGLVPVVDSQNNPLQPCKPSVAERLIKKGKATGFFKKGFFAIRIKKTVEKPNRSLIVVAIDPGSKRTGITVTTDTEVIVNIQCNTPDWVKGKMETRLMYRRARRQRNTPYRKCRSNRAIGNIPPSTKARWDAHLRIIDVLSKILPVTDIVIEDIQAITKKHQKKWNRSFSPLEIGKQWFKKEVENRGFEYTKFQGFETKTHRDIREFKKTSKKLSEVWEAHCVDSHCLAEMLTTYIEPVKQITILNFLQFNRRELHQGYQKGKIRKLYGSTKSMGFNRGTLIKHTKYGLTQVGGTSQKRLCQNAKIQNCKILTNLSWRTAIPPMTKVVGLLAGCLL